MEKEEAKKELEGMVKKAKDASTTDAEKAKAAEEQKKADEAKVLADAQAKRESEIAEASEEDLKDPKKFTAEELAKRPDIVEKRRKEKEAAEASESADAKLKRVKEETQKAIDRISNELKQVKDKSSKEAEDLRRQLAEAKEKIEAPKKEDIQAQILKQEQDRIAKFLKEDEEKPREERREMPDEEWEQWELEEPAKAKRWLNQNEERRRVERKKDLDNHNLNGLMERHHQSALRTQAKHPELDTDARTKELEAEGKSKEEIVATLIKENDKLRICNEIRLEHPEWIVYADWPERIVTEMEKRISSQSTSGSETAKLIARVEELEAKLAEKEAGDEGINSTVKSAKGTISVSEGEAELVKTMKEMKLPQESINKRIKEYREKHGISA